MEVDEICRRKTQKDGGHIKTRGQRYIKIIQGHDLLLKETNNASTYSGAPAGRVKKKQKPIKKDT